MVALLDDERYRHRLPDGHVEQGYRFEGVLGDGGFGITYLAHDLAQDRKVAIKEYIPNEVAVRHSGLLVQPKSESERENFEWGLERFVQEAQVLTRFDHPNIVRVHRFFRANSTGYMVMSYVEGQSLFDVLDHRGTLNERALKDILEPLLSGLEAVHKAHFLHRDIKPENIYIGLDGQPVLLDFGAARQALGGRSRQVTTIVTPGYAPNEQYAVDGNLGPWTDIYALAGVLYTCITGEAPVEAPARANALLRSKSDPLVPATEAGRGRYSRPFLEAVDHGLAVVEEQRPPTVPDWRTEFRTGARPQESLLLNVKAPVQTIADRPPASGPPGVAGGAASARGSGGGGAGGVPGPSETMVLPLTNVVPHGPTGQEGLSDRKSIGRKAFARTEDTRKPVQSPPAAPSATVGWGVLALALVLAGLGWGLYPLLVADFRMPLGRFDLATAIAALAAGILVGGSLAVARSGVGLAGIFLIGAGWAVGVIGRFLSFEFVRLSGLQPNQSTNIAAGAVIGILGGFAIGWALRLSPARLAVWRWPVLIGVWGGLWAAKYHGYFLVTQELGRRVARQEMAAETMRGWLQWADVGLFALAALLGTAVTLWLAPGVRLGKRGAAVTRRGEARGKGRPTPSPAQLAQTARVAQAQAAKEG